MNQLTFQKALSESAELLDRFADQGPTGENLAALARLVGSIESGRGFFATFLTGSWPLCDQQPQWFLDALRGSAPVVSDLLCRNLVMSLATSVVHERKGDQDNRAGSLRVAERSEQLISRLSMAELSEQVETYVETVRQRLATGEVSDDHQCAQFLARRQYDDEQLQVVLDRLELLLRKLGDSDRS